MKSQNHLKQQYVPNYDSLKNVVFTLNSELNVNTHIQLRKCERHFIKTRKKRGIFDEKGSSPNKH